MSIERQATSRASVRHARRFRRIAMKTVISALVALSVLSGYAASAFADKVPQSIWEQLDREGRGGHPT
jgi:hypothetical protein